MSQLTRYIILPVLLITIFAICLVEGFYYWGEKYFGLHETSGSAVSSRSVPVSDGLAVTKDTKKPIDFSVIVKRNLFAADKIASKDDKQTDPLSNLQKSSLDVVLMGTVSGREEEERAIIYDKKEKKQDLYQVGDYIQQAIIKQIMRGKVILNFNGRDEMLDISEARNVKVPRVAKAAPVVQTKKVVGRPVGQSGGSTGTNLNNTSGAVGAPAGAQSRNPKQLRSYRGGVIVKDKTAAPQQ